MIKSISFSQDEILQDIVALHTGLCECGCGGAVKPGNKFINYHNRKGIILKGKEAAHWRGGVKIGKGGYVYIYQPDHPYATCQGYVLEHRLVMEEYLGRYLEPDEISHHCNEITNDNGIENLDLTIRAEHVRIHKPRMKRGKECGDN